MLFDFEMRNGIVAPSQQQDHHRMPMPAKQASDYGVSARSAAAALRKEKKTAEISKEAKLAVELMVYEGLKRKEAAETVGMHEESLRRALTKPNTLAYMNECMEVLRTSGRPRALRKMIELVDEAKTERIQFEAAKYLDGMDRPSHAVGATQVNVQVNNTVTVTPGYTIDLRPDDDEEATEVRQIRHLERYGSKPLDMLDDVPDED